MFDVDTLFVINSSRDYVLDDMLAMINWSANGGSHFTVVVDFSRTVRTLSTPGKYQIVHPEMPEETPEGFYRAAGLKWAIEQGIMYRQVIMLSDTTLLTTQTVDRFFMDNIQKDGVGLIAVRSNRSSERVWQAGRNQLFEWQLPVDGWERAPVAVCDDFMVLSAKFSAAMFQRKLTLPSGCANWPGDYGTYISWVCHLLGFYCVSWGSELKPLPPLYIGRSQGQWLPPPQLFGQKLLAFGPINKIMGYAEGDIRELYKQQRGERAREVIKHGPLVTGPEQIDVVF